MLLGDATVLIVDDEPVLSQIIGERLQRHAREVCFAGDGEEGVRVLAQTRVDLIISDIRMPRLDGIGMLRAMRTQGIHRPCLIFISGYSDARERELFDLGAEDLLTKPIDFPRLLESAQNCLLSREELWHIETKLPNEVQKIALSFPSLPMALKAGEISFGRGGFSLHTEQKLWKGPVGIDIRFMVPSFVFSGQGAVRWTDGTENQAGIEISYVSDGARDQVVKLTEGQRSYIPRSTENAHLNPGLPE